MALRHIFVLSFALLGGVPPLALEAQRPRGVFGARTGVNLSTLAVGEATAPDIARRVGAAVGLYLEAGSGPLALRPELLFSPKGATFDGRNDEFREYIDVSLLLVARPVRWRIVEPFLATGSTVSFCRDGCGGQTRTLDLGVTAAGGVSRPVGALTLMIEGRYTRGLVDYLYAASRERTNRFWTLSAGAGFGVY